MKSHWHQKKTIKKIIKKRMTDKINKKVGQA